MAPDPKWLEILKASGWQTAAITAAAVLLVFGNSRKLLPIPLETWMIQVAVVTALVCGCLTLASIASATARTLKRPLASILGAAAKHREKRRIERELPLMTSQEREIIGYLLAHNQRMFTNVPDCGHANTLISKGIVVSALRPGQLCTHFEVPFEVPDFVWDLLQKHKDKFPYERSKEPGPHPWRRHWMG